MKKLSLFLTAFLLFGGTAMAGFLNHPNFAKINTFTASVIGTIKTYQDQYFVTNGRYFQGLWLLGNQQVDGNTDVAVINTSAPSDQQVTWRDFAPTVFRNNLKIPVNVRIDVYQSPQGWGWVLVAECWIDGLGPDAFGNNGNHWVYNHSEGPSDIGLVEDVWYIEPTMPEF